MSGECDECGEHALECKCELIEMNKMRIENLKRQKFYLEKLFPWTCGPYEDEDDEGKCISLNEKLVMTCEFCESEMIALHGFFVICPNCHEENKPCQADEKLKSEKETND